MSIISPNSRLVKYGLQLTKTAIFQTILARAGGIMAHPMKMFDLLKKATQKTKKYNNFSEFSMDMGSHFYTLSEMVKASVKGDYLGLRKADVAMIVAAIIYFISPLDLVPDAIPFIGLLDDISLLTWLINKLSVEMEQFTNWRIAQNSLEAVPTIDIEYEDLTYNELYKEAQAQDITGRSGMKKAELIKALKNRKN